jgi:methyl-accepting chemotaxis protein|tara:strand:- start:797 stop:1021 length:225 start_codon:yes stop_codon:yes gene_type:complete
MNGYDYKLKEQTSNNISDIASGIDDLRSDLNNNSKVNYKIIDNRLGDICTSVEELTSQISIFNKTMERIAESLK